MLRDLSTRLIPENDYQQIFDQIVAVTVVLTHASTALLYMLDDSSLRLNMLAAYNPSPALIESARRIDLYADSALLEMYTGAGYQSAHIKPLLTRAGTRIGALSVCWRESYSVTDQDQDCLDMLAQQAADLLERQHTQQVLNENTQQIQLIIDSARDYAIFSIDTDGNVLTWNTGAENVFGYSEAEIVGLNMDVLYMPDDRANHVPEQERQRAAEAGYSEDERWHLHKDGRRLFVSGMVRPIRDEVGALKGFTKVGRDNTERRLAESRAVTLQRLTAALSARLTPAEMAVSIIQAIHEVVGEAICVIYLLQADGHTFEILMNDGLLPEHQHYAPVMTTQDSVTATALRMGENQWVASQAEYRQHYPNSYNTIIEIGIHSIISLPLKVNKRTIGTLSIAFRQPRTRADSEQDLLTAIAYLCAQALERAQLFQNEALARREAEEANALKMKFLGMISHELRTPLASIKGFSDTLLATDVTFSAEEQMQFIRIIDEQADKLSGLVDQLLDLTRLQAGALRIDLQPVSLQQVFVGAETQLQTLSAEHQLGIQIAEPLPEVVADSERIGQVLVNLVGNAAKFSPTGTSITITARQDSRFVQVDVSDQGIGIPVESREKIFEAFQQANRNLPSHRLGAGLGLAICKSIIEAHHGRIWVQDRTAGSTISFTLPIVG